MTVESVTYINDLDVNNPSGGDSISEGDDHIRNIKKSIKNTFPNVSEPVTVTADDLNKVSDFVAGGNGIFASCKTRNGTELMYGHNVTSVDRLSDSAVRINFRQPTDGFDHHYAVLVQPYASSGWHVVATVYDQRDSYVEVVFTAYDGSYWVTPPSLPGFSMMMTDMIQTESNANT